mgnify:CR=1 FL=1
MDYSSLIGITVALAGIIGGQLLEGGYVGSLLQSAAFLIVLGGTAGAVMVQSPARVFVRGVRMAKWVVLPPEFEPQRIITDVLRWSQSARKEGLLSLEQQADRAADPFARKGLQLLVDGVEPEKLREAMEVEIITFEEYHRQAARIWEAAGGYAPTIGILGAVLGLIHVMENLSEPARLGSGTLRQVCDAMSSACSESDWLPVTQTMPRRLSTLSEYGVSLPGGTTGRSKRVNLPVLGS